MAETLSMPRFGQVVKVESSATEEPFLVFLLGTLVGNYAHGLILGEPSLPGANAHSIVRIIWPFDWVVVDEGIE